MVTKTSSATAERIMRALVRIVLEAGIEAVRVDLVATRSGVNKRMIYHHFGDKDGLLQALFQRQLAVLVQMGEALSESSISLLRGLCEQRFGRSFVDEVKRIPTAEYDQGDAQAALQILLPQLSGNGLSDETSGVLPQDEAGKRTFALFAVEVVGLLFPGMAHDVLSAVPGSSEYVNVCKRLLTAGAARKPVYRIKSNSRRPAAG